jgi:hypothetical protein
MKTMGGSDIVSLSVRSQLTIFTYYSGWLKEANHFLAFIITQHSKRGPARDSYFFTLFFQFFIPLVILQIRFIYEKKIKKFK